jgi:hypothetical protein
MDPRLNATLMKASKYRSNRRFSSKQPDMLVPLADVFISYARTDLKIAENVAEMLQSEHAAT